MFGFAIFLGTVLRKLIVPTFSGEQDASPNEENIGDSNDASTIQCGDSTNCEVAINDSEIFNQLYHQQLAKVTALEGDIRQLIQRIEQQSNELEESRMRHQDQTDQLKTLTTKLQEKGKKLVTAESELPIIIDELNKQHEELCKKDQVIESLRIEMKSYEANNTKAMAIDQLLVNSNNVKATCTRSNARAFVHSGSKLAEFISKKFVPEKLTNTPRPPVMEDTNKEEGQTAIEDQAAGIRLSELELIVARHHPVKLPPRPSVIKRQPPVSQEEWESFRDQSGHISAANQDHFLARVFYGGINPDIRAETWKYLLDFMPFDRSDSDRMMLRREKAEEYYSMKKQWKSFSDIQLQRFQHFREHRELINDDVYRTDREVDKYKSSSSQSLKQLVDILTTYVMYNVDLGYAQGMSDMLTPILYVVDDEVDAFWCFSGLMERMMRIFEPTQEYTKERIKRLRTLVMIFCPNLHHVFMQHGGEELFFCFRWLLVSFKREFSYVDVMKIWEVIWINRLSTDYAIFIALAILDKHAEKICYHANEYGISGIVEYINGLPYTMDVDEVLELAECYIHQLSEMDNIADEIKVIINNPLPGRQAVPWQHNHTVFVPEVSKDIN